MPFFHTSRSLTKVQYPVFLFYEPGSRATPPLSSLNRQFQESLAVSRIISRQEKTQSDDWPFLGILLHLLREVDFHMLFAQNEQYTTARFFSFGFNRQSWLLAAPLHSSTAEFDVHRLTKIVKRSTGTTCEDGANFPQPSLIQVPRYLKLNLESTLTIRSPPEIFHLFTG